MTEYVAVAVDEDGMESHESWITMGVNRVSAHPGQHLFDSEIAHQHYVQVTISRCKRERHLNHDWIFSTKVIAELRMSFAQWGAFVSSFGVGSGVPATLSWLDGPVPQAPHDPRLGESVREVREAGDKALAEIQSAYDKMAEAFERGAGKREMRECLHDLGIRLGNAPGNMAYAAKTLVEHTENVVTKARADIEAMIAAAADTGERSLMAGEQPLLAAPKEEG